jgi:hypothetical protein
LQFYFSFRKWNCFFLIDCFLLARKFNDFGTKQQS